MIICKKLQAYGEYFHRIFVFWCIRAEIGQRFLHFLIIITDLLWNKASLKIIYVYIAMLTYLQHAFRIACLYIFIKYFIKTYCTRLLHRTHINRWYRVCMELYVHKYIIFVLYCNELIKVSRFCFCIFMIEQRTRTRTVSTGLTQLTQDFFMLFCDATSSFTFTYSLGRAICFNIVFGSLVQRG